MRQTAQIITVLHTSASDRDIGLITLDIVTANGTEMPIVIVKPTIKSSKVVFFDICSKKTGKLYI